MADEIDFAKTLRTTKDKVAFILERHPKARDNDKYLYLVYLRMFCNAKSLQSANFDEFATYIMEREVPMPETIRRVRAKLQEEHEKYRGEAYAKRHRAAEGVSNWAVNG